MSQQPWTPCALSPETDEVRPADAPARLSDPQMVQLAVVVNGEERTTAARTLLELVEELGHTAPVATALNGQFIPARARHATMLTAGCRVEILSPRQGG